MTLQVDFLVFDEFLEVLITKGSEGIPGYIANQDTNKTESFNWNHPWR